MCCVTVFSVITKFCQKLKKIRIIRSMVVIVISQSLQNFISSPFSWSSKPIAILMGKLLVPLIYFEIPIYKCQHHNLSKLLLRLVLLSSIQFSIFIGIKLYAKPKPSAVYIFQNQFFIIIVGYRKPFYNFKPFAIKFFL